MLSNRRNLTSRLLRRLPVLLLLLGMALPAMARPGPVFALGNQTVSPTLSLVATYVNISVYLSFQDDANGNNQASLDYRQAGGLWKQGMAMTVDRRDTIHNAGRTYTNTFKDQWRASVLGLQPGTQYEVRVTITDPDSVSGTNPVVASISTRVETDQIPSTGRSLYVSPTGSDLGDGSAGNPWQTTQKAADNVVAGDTVYVQAGTYNEAVFISRSGASDNYITFRNLGTDSVTVTPPGTSATTSPAVQPDQVALAVTGSYLRIKGFTFATSSIGIMVADSSHDVIIEDSVVTDWTIYGIRIGGSSARPDRYTFRSSVENITVQNNHVKATIADPGNVRTIDPGLVESGSFNKGGHVIRDNRLEFFYTGPDNLETHGEDCISSQPNSSYADTYKDTDIYRNLCIGATDDGIELDGNNVNTRVWENTIIKTSVGFSVAASAVGPTYIYRNLFHQPNYHRTYCVGVKYGRGGTGHVYFYHNTFHLTGSTCDDLQIPDGAGGFKGAGRGTLMKFSGGGLTSDNLTFRNNIQHFAEREISSGSAGGVPTNFWIDYNLNYDESGGLYAKHGGILYGSMGELTATAAWVS